MYRPQLPVICIKSLQMTNQKIFREQYIVKVLKYSPLIQKKKDPVLGISLKCIAKVSVITINCNCLSHDGTVRVQHAQKGKES